MGSQRGKPLASILIGERTGGGVYAEEGCGVECGVAEERGDFGFDGVEAGVVDAVDFCEGDGAAGDAEELEDGDVLARLRHDAVVSGDYQ
jgi:hypothetical protein